jgi:cytochrome c2
MREAHWRRAAAWVSASVAVGLAVVASGTLAAQTGGPQPAVALSIELPDNPMAGAQLFVDKGCVLCHSLGGDQPKLGPDLGRIHFRGTVMDLAAAFWNHAPVMREKMQDLKIQLPVLNSREMADLVAFLTAYRYYLTEVGQPGDPVAGKAVFAAKGCARCHGTGDWTKSGPDLARLRGRFSVVVVAQAMWNHGSEMATTMRGQGVAFPKFAGREMGDLLAFLQAGADEATEERVYFEPGSPRRGRELFVSKQCTVCHAIAGRGGSGGPDLGRHSPELTGSISEIAGLLWNHNQEMSAGFSRRGVPRVTFSGVEMADILAYLYFVNYANVQGFPERGSQVFAAKCASCHSPTDGKRVGVDLTTAPDLSEPLAILAAMWEHAPKMDHEMRLRNLPWPSLELGDAADLTAFLISRRTMAPAH